MSTLFETGKDGIPSDESLIKALLFGRGKFQQGEDDWLEPELSEVRPILGPEFATMSLHLLHKLLVRLRKDKKVITEKSGKSMAERLSRVCRDYDRMRKRRSSTRSKEYDDYISSQQWRDRASKHRKDCNYKCQLCGREGRLDVHHTLEGYRNMGREQVIHLLAVCRTPCHVIADFLRETRGDFNIEDEASTP